MGPCNSGYWESPAASPVGLNGRSRYRGSQGRVPGGACIFAPSVWSATACRRKRLLVLLEALHCSYLEVQKSARRRTSFLGNHDTFWRSSLPRRALQTLAGKGPACSSPSAELKRKCPLDNYPARRARRSLEQAGRVCRPWAGPLSGAMGAVLTRSRPPQQVSRAHSRSAELSAAWITCTSCGDNEVVDEVVNEVEEVTAARSGGAGGVVTGMRNVGTTLPPTFGRNPSTNPDPNFRRLVELLDGPPPPPQ